MRQPCAAAAEARGVPELSRSQLLVYGAIAVAVLLVGARWIRSDDGESSSDPGLSFAADASPGGERGSEDVVVHVAGAVGRAGVYRLPAGARVTDAVRRAGGLAPGAQGDAINLAARLSDGQQVVVPGRGAAVAAASGETAGPISLGSATADQLDEIEGIGPVTAQKIIEFRDQHGGLSSVDELDQISGIGPSTMEALRAGLQP
jgi:competence protein ComEA